MQGRSYKVNKSENLTFRTINNSVFLLMRIQLINKIYSILYCYIIYVFLTVIQNYKFKFNLPI